MYNDPFFTGGRFGSHSTMTMDGLTCVLHMPAALKSRMQGGSEVAHRLPPGAPRAAFLVDDYPAAPEQWLRSEAGMCSYMAPVKSEHGLWLDFNGNWRHKHDVAVVISAQGINAITGMKSDKLRLEQYKHRCPVHNTEFVGNRRCSKCGFEWPAQNYICTTGAPNGLLWLDGFRSADGTVRQWVFTESESRGVAKAVIGDERVHALGILFFLSKKPKPPRPQFRSRGLGDSAYQLESLSMGGDMHTKGIDFGQTRGGGTRMRSMSFGSSVRSAQPVIPEKTFEIAAGAKVDQKIHPDPKELDYWQEEPAGMIVINYTDEATLLKVLEAGTSASGEGFLGEVDVQVGH